MKGWTLLFLGFFLGIVSSTYSATAAMATTLNDPAAQAQADKLLAENPYKDREGQQELDEDKESKVKSFFKKKGAEVKAIAYAGGRLTWEGVKKAAKFVRNGLGFGLSFAAQVFKMVVFFLCFNATLGVVTTVIL